MHCFLVIGVLLIEGGGFVYGELSVFRWLSAWLSLERNLRRNERRKGKELEISTHSSTLNNSLRAEDVFQPLRISRIMPGPLPDNVCLVAKAPGRVRAEAGWGALWEKAAASLRSLAFFWPPPWILKLWLVKGLFKRQVRSYYVAKN